MGPHSVTMHVFKTLYVSKNAKCSNVGVFIAQVVEHMVHKLKTLSSIYARYILFCLS